MSLDVFLNWIRHLYRAQPLPWICVLYLIRVAADREQQEGSCLQVLLLQAAPKHLAGHWKWDAGPNKPAEFFIMEARCTIPPLMH